MGVIKSVLGKFLAVGQRSSDGQMMPIAVNDLGELKVVGAGVATNSNILINDNPTGARVVGGELLVETGGLTDAQLRATPVPVSFPADESGLTDAQLRATPINVETELVQPLTDAQLRATPVPVETELGAAGPLATEASLLATSSEFARILKFQPAAGEEIRRDETLTDDYHGVAPDGTLTSAASWKVVRFYKTAGLITRVRYRTGVEWDSRTVGW